MDAVRLHRQGCRRRPVGSEELAYAATHTFGFATHTAEQTTSPTAGVDQPYNPQLSRTRRRGRLKAKCGSVELSDSFHLMQSLCWKLRQQFRPIHSAFREPALPRALVASDEFLKSVLPPR